MVESYQYLRLEALREMFGSDEVIAHILGVVAESMPLMLADLRAAWEKGDYAATAGAAHKAKSGFRQIELHEIGAAVEAIEKIARNATEHEFLTIAALLADLEQQYAPIAQELNRFVQSHT